jgi:hypothetical protein
MHIYYILPFVAFGLGVTNAAAIDDTNMLDTRAPQCPLGIKLIQLQIKHNKFFTGVGSPGECKRIPKNIKDFEFDSPGTKSLVPCFVCTVWEHSDCTGDSETIEGFKPHLTTQHKNNQQWKSWKCECKD